MKRLQTILSDKDYEKFRKKCFNARTPMSKRSRGLILEDLKES